MSVNVDTVYQRVLAILNKEQRGFLTPQEFNLFANQAQMDLFEQYFYDVNQFGRMHGNDTEYSDMLNILNEKIAAFATDATPSQTNGYFVLPDNFYRLGTVLIGNKQAQRLNRNEYKTVINVPLAAPNDEFPVYVENASGYKVYGAIEKTTGVTFEYVKKPTTVEWVGTNVNGIPLYNSVSSVNFDLHPSEETELVIKILELAGILIRDLSIYQVAAGEEAKNTQQEKS